MLVWFDSNLCSLIVMLKLYLFLVYVCVLIGMVISCNNCYFFVVGKWSFMYNGQFGGYDSYCCYVDVLIFDDYYQYCKGVIDSEVLFLMVLVEGLEIDFVVVMFCVIVKFEMLVCDCGIVLYVCLIVVFLDGQWFYVLCYVSDDYVLMFYYCWLDMWGGCVVVFEFLESDEEGWQEIFV